MEYLLHILIISGIYIILTLSLNLIVGYTGLAALGHIAFACVGAYASSLFALNFGVSPWIGLMVGACMASLLGHAKFCCSSSPADDIWPSFDRLNA